MRAPPFTATTAASAVLLSSSAAPWGGGLSAAALLPPQQQHGEDSVLSAAAAAPSKPSSRGSRTSSTSSGGSDLLEDSRTGPVSVATTAPSRISFRRSVGAELPAGELPAASPARPVKFADYARETVERVKSSLMSSVSVHQVPETLRAFYETRGFRQLILGHVLGKLSADRDAKEVQEIKEAFKDGASTTTSSDLSSRRRGDAALRAAVLKLWKRDASGEEVVEHYRKPVSEEERSVNAWARHFDLLHALRMEDILRMPRNGGGDADAMAKDQDRLLIEDARAEAETERIGLPVEADDGSNANADAWKAALTLIDARRAALLRTAATSPAARHELLRWDAYSSAIRRIHVDGDGGSLVRKVVNSLAGWF